LGFLEYDVPKPAVVFEVFFGAFAAGRLLCEPGGKIKVGGRNGAFSVSSSSFFLCWTKVSRISSKVFGGKLQNAADPAL
jgi:hypothetical protein